MTTDRVFKTESLQENQQAKAFVLSGDPNKAMQQMMEQIDALRDVYMEENEALQNSDTKTFLQLQDRKIGIAKDYHSGAQQLLTRKDDLEHISDALKQELEDKQEEFGTVMTENLKALDRMRKGVQRLNDRVVKGAREAVQKSNMNYGESGVLHKNDRAVSIGVNESA